jgi:NAD(P)H-nitrite reductase large subunit
MQVDYLIIGNSVAAVNAIEGVRERDEKGSILVVSEEPYENYSRPLISYFLGDRIKRQALEYKDASFYREMKVEVVCARAESLDCIGKKVFLSDRKHIGYGKLLIAIGGSPVIPGIEGFAKETSGLFTFSGLGDALALKQYIEENAIEHAVVLGAGLIGLKAAEGLLMKGVKVTVIELADRILPNTFDLRGSEIVENELIRSGSTLIKNDTIVSIQTHQGSIVSVTLKSGRVIETGCLVIAVGVRPNLAIVQNTTIVTRRGIIVDEHLQTTEPGIFAAGDVAECPDFFDRKPSLIAIWPVAARTGRIAGFNMAGGNRVYFGLFPMNAVQILGIPSISFGITEPRGADFKVLEHFQSGVYRKLVLKDNRLVGAILIGNIERAGIYGMLIKERLDVSSFEKELLSDTFGFLVLPKEFRKHMVTGEGIEV